MGENTDQTVKEIESIRAQIDSDIDELAAVLPPREQIVSQLVVAGAAGVVVVLSLWFVARRRRTRKDERRIRRLVREAIDETRA